MPPAFSMLVFKERVSEAIAPLTALTYLLIQRPEAEAHEAYLQVQP
ncbi:MAG: hypothetical protein F6K17_42375 [Okeania sp. SIO3C4]|nr:hypothetical protein [Okeania sp. SIO3C4]